MTDSPASEEKKHWDDNSNAKANRDHKNGGSHSTLDQSDSNHASVGSSNAYSVKSGSQARKASRIPKVRTPRRGACSDSSSDQSSSDDGNDDVDDIPIPSYHNSRAAPRNGNDDNTTAGDSASASYQADSGNSNNNNHGEGNNSSGVSPDQERQILLLMLLAQVCALHDPTPRTFTVHVLELFERGILGRQSIHFLFELGLVPSSAPRLLPPSTTEREGGGTNQEVLDLATISPTASPASPQSLRTQEASAIRSHLEQHDLAQETTPNLLSPQGEVTNNNNDNTTALTSTADSPTKQKKKSSSWAVEHHPLSLSRYQREFHQVRLLNAGSFGEVFQATSKIDLRDYAVKRVAFSAWGYSRDSVTQVIREVHCLAQCDHPNVVRYYTSWLEPSWMTGSGATMISSTGNSNAEVRHQQKLLTDIQHMMITGGDNTSLGQSQQQSTLDSGNNSNSSIQGFLQGQVASLRDRKFSMGSSLDSFDNSAGSSYDETSSDEESCSHHWTAVDDNPNRSRDDSILFQSHSREWWESSSAPRRCKTQGNGNRKQLPSLKYRYQICLFIQMQLCHPATLGDWIRNRNSQTSGPHQDRHHRVVTATKIFGQIASGLNHIHKKNIVHRDLKPANLFRSLEDDGVFLIGDFGLSKLIHSATNHNGKRQRPNSEGNAPVYHPPAHPDVISAWQDPLTAGVGTASYAANEQVTTRTYGKPADIFSLGLILLELVCCFGTEHERMQTFNDCRNRRDVPSWISKEYPAVASTILACTESDPGKRPAAEELLELDLLDAASVLKVSNSETSHNTNIPEQSENAPHNTGNLVAQLRQELANKNEEIQSFQTRLKEKDQTIEELRRELAQLKARHSDVATSHVQYISTSLTVKEVASSSSSSGGEDM